MKYRKYVVAGVIVAAVAIIGVFIIGMAGAGQVGNRPGVDSPAPDFPIELYQNYQANLPRSLKLSDLHGKIVVINFWASWCVECRKESDALQQTYLKYANRDVIVLGIDYLDTEPAAVKYLEQYNTTYPVGADIQQQISHAYRITGVPETFFVDKKGKIRKIVIQALAKDELVNTVESLLSE